MSDIKKIEQEDSASTFVDAIPDYKLADLIFVLKTTARDSQAFQSASSALFTAIKEQKLAPLYYFIHNSSETANLLPWDESLYNDIFLQNEKHLIELKDAIKKAEEEEEELSISESWNKLGNYYAKIGNKDKAISTLRHAQDLSSGTGNKIDIMLTIIRIGLFYDDKAFVKKELESVKLLIDRGGDWERRNRFKTYQGLYLLSIRQFEEAANLLIDSLSTFTSTEITSYEEIVKYAVLSGAFALDRVNLKRKVVDSPEVLSLVPTTPSLEPITVMTNSLYTCEYDSYFKALATVEVEVLKTSRYLASHSLFYIREMRRKAYAQLLESYKTLSIRSMADAFGISVSFLDNDLAKFIPSKKLNCVIDRVNGIIVTNRPDNKNAQYQEFVKQGDALLTKLQKYGAAVRLSGAERLST
ncbi:uncharacterized protein SAPINGB_P003852 [Magnusiomyces paraingens]|uniref:PCI domain-containing protein n=1 Tax=Magnusiomyces paraingens TaxID=2606893 RepID=A0A5E8BSI6_9ASCO|nr:uncharacterized protein SAPINGB_P003852 [Saprochaete ingens]VVT53991.1 unnamed protein product [Saprochaete ingens]